MLILATSFTWHKYYVSVTEIKNNKEDSKLEITIKIFADDLQNALDVILGKPVNIGSENQYPQYDSLQTAYINNNFSIKVDGKECTLKKLGQEIEGESIWLYYYIDGVESINTITLKNSILTELYKEQRNVVKVIIDDEIRSSLLTKSRSVRTFSFK